MANSKIAIVHDWVEKVGGSEKVVEEMTRVFPDSTLYVLWSNDSERFDVPTRETFLSSTIFKNKKASTIPLQLVAWRYLIANPEKLEKVLISSHLFAHHARFPNSPGALKYVYTHSPARYVWEPERDSRGDKLIFRLASELLKPLDKKRSKEAFRIAANSRFTQSKILRSWERESDVIYPPVDVASIRETVQKGIQLENLQSEQLSLIPSEFILGASRFIAYKGLERVIEIGEWLNIPVVLAGAGPLLGRLRQRAESAKVRVIVIDQPSDKLLLLLYSRCLTYVFPAIEDFGIMPLEATAAGAAVLANYIGGTSETVLEGVNGAVVDMSSKADIVSGFFRTQSIPKQSAIEHAMKFDSSVFRTKISEWVS